MILPVNLEIKVDAVKVGSGIVQMECFFEIKKNCCQNKKRFIIKINSDYM